VTPVQGLADEEGIEVDEDGDDEESPSGRAMDDAIRRDLESRRRQAVDAQVCVKLHKC